MTEYIVELDSKHSIALRLAYAEEMRGGDFVREEIVRCRDCKYSSISFEETRTTCRFWALNDYDESNSSHGYTLYPCVKPYGFCAWGERREKS